MAFAKGVVVKGDIVATSAGSGLKTLAAGTHSTKGGEKAAVEL